MKFLLIIFLLCIPIQKALAQNTSLEVTVIDQNNAVVPNLTARLKENKLVREVKIIRPQKIIFSNIKVGQYLLEIESPGFKTYSEIIEINNNSEKIVTLEVSELTENVDVNQSKQDKLLDPREGAFTNFLTKSEIEALPDDPQLMKEALKRRFGDDAEFFVDGFNSEGLPRKSQITAIKVSQSSFDAEYHKIGIAIIEFTTKPNARFFGEFNFNFNDAILNAREVFSDIRYPTRNLSFDLYFAGPIKKERTSFSIGLINTRNYDSNAIIATLPDNNFIRTTQNQSNRSNFEGRIRHLVQFQTINLVYSFNKNTSKNLGVGGFNLPERAYNLYSQDHQIRYSQVGNIKERFYNEFRFQFTNQSAQIISLNNEPTVIVLDAFTRGGAGRNGVNKNQSFSIADNFLWGIKNHALKVGANLDYTRQKTIYADNQDGTFTFSSLPDFLSNRPSVFTQSAGTRNIEFSQFQLGAFIQDDIRINKSLMLSLGLRYELQNNLKDYNNFSPRIGFAWSPKENGKTTFRGGIGIFYNWFEPNIFANILSQDATQPGTAIIINPGFPNPYLGGTSQILPTSYSQKASDLQNPSTFLGQFGIQRQLTEKASIRFQYSYQKGIHQFRSRDINAPINFIRPNTNLGQIKQLESSAFFVSNILKADFNIAPTRKTYLSVSYRLGKTISDSRGIFELPSDNYNIRLDRSVSDIDQRHNIYANFIWALPNSFRLVTTYYANSALPYTITTGIDDNGDTVFNDRPFGVVRNSERGTWQKQFDTSLSWKLHLKNTDNQPSSNTELEALTRKTFTFTINAKNIFNQTNFINYSGIQTSSYFRQPISANMPRRISFGLTYIF